MSATVAALPTKARVGDPRRGPGRRPSLASGVPVGRISIRRVDADTSPSTVIDSPATSTPTPDRHSRTEHASPSRVTAASKLRTALRRAHVRERILFATGRHAEPERGNTPSRLTISIKDVGFEMDGYPLVRLIASTRVGFIVLLLGGHANFQSRAARERSNSHSRAALATGTRAARSPSLGNVHARRRKHGTNGRVPIHETRWRLTSHDSPTLLLQRSAARFGLHALDDSSFFS